MLQYLLETLAFQLIFLLTYDIFLKKETFFQWNRAYLLVTFPLSLLLPWVKIEALKTTVSTEAVFYPEFLWQMSEMILVPETPTTSFWSALSVYEKIFLFGVVIMTIWLLVKLYRIQRLRSTGTVSFYKGFTKVIVKQSEVAFSFFKQVFLGDGIAKEKEPQILAHELVHIKQWHSLDLLLFELLRIGLWFNPLVYVYQSRMAELHEFIADAQVAKHNKKEQYQLLLSEAFQTQNLSFVNQFFKQSLIKKRIVMLTKQKSKAVYQFKYVLLLPLVLGMLVYTSCEGEVKQEIGVNEFDFNEIVIEVEDIDDKKSWDDNFNKMLGLKGRNCLVVTDSKDYQKHYYVDGMGVYSEDSRFLEKSKAQIALVDTPPIFPGCENENYKRSCFESNIRTHFQAHLKYPEEARNKGIEGSVAVQITIDKNGVISEFQRRSSHESLNLEVDRLIRLLPKMKPAKLGNKAVQMIYIFPVIFDLDEQDFMSDATLVPFATIEQVPIFPDCENASDKRACFQEKIQEHIRKHFNYPQEAQDQDIQGRVAVMFTINVNGDIVDIRKRGPHELLEDEVERIINRLPKMTPGKHDGKVVNVPFSIPITFRLQDSSNTPIPFPKMASDADGLSAKAKLLISEYNFLIGERNRLLDIDKSNPVINELEDQLRVMKININEEIKIGEH